MMAFLFTMFQFLAVIGLFGTAMALAIAFGVWMGQF